VVFDYIVQGHINRDIRHLGMGCRVSLHRGGGEEGIQAKKDYRWMQGRGGRCYRLKIVQCDSSVEPVGDPLLRADGVKSVEDTRVQRLRPTVSLSDSGKTKGRISEYALGNKTLSV
jgi:hypothetical protein